ncbi:MAG: DUF4445 domain-containing protein [Proteobacteria bacterium]|nr:DUF4445 domain-containing protein [Pseudomonadota bacterium]
MSSIVFEPINKRVHCSEGITIAEVARNAGVSLVSSCGSQGTCGKCRVFIISGHVSPITNEEKEKISAKDIERGCRLACLTRVYDEVKVKIPPKSLISSQRLQVAGNGKTAALDPLVKRYDITLSPPSMLDQKSDQTALFAYLDSQYGLKDLKIDLSAQRQLPLVLRANEWKAQIVLRGREIIMAGESGKRLLGLAVDLGTTKIAAYLADLETGEILAAKAVVNRQMAYGQDLMARLNHAMGKEAETLRQAAADDINQLIRELCKGTDLSGDQILEAVVVGNTAMHHLFLGLPVRQLALAPYIPAVSDSMDIKARDLGLAIAPGAYVHLLPNIAGFVGADHVAVLLATGIYNTEKTTIGIDIGTNTEISLAVKDRLLSTSCASGPAFEGAHIKYGMRAEGGAIEKVKITGSSVEIRTINNEPPVGICGSGILDAIAQLRKAGIIDRMGKMLAHPLVRDGEKGQEFVLVYAQNSGSGTDITITETDISEILMAKAAIAAALNILLEETKLTWDEVDEILIAGAFGSYIDVASAIEIGMFAAVPMNRFSQIGNAAGTGAKLALLSKEQRELSMAITRKATYVELTNHPQYLRKFSRAIRLPA